MPESAWAIKAAFLDVDSGEALLCTASRRSRRVRDRGDRARQISHKTSGRPCRHVLIRTMSSQNQIMALTIPFVIIHAQTPPSIPHINSYPSNTKWLNLGNVNHLSFQLSKSHRVPNVEDVAYVWLDRAMCGFIVLPPRNPLASQALHHFRSTSRIPRETQVVQHTDHLIKLSKFKNVIASELRIIDRLSVN